MDALHVSIHSSQSRLTVNWMIADHDCLEDWVGTRVCCDCRDYHVDVDAQQGDVPHTLHFPNAGYGSVHLCLVGVNDVHSGLSLCSAVPVKYGLNEGKIPLWEVG